jgi:hypothetical protein
LDVAKLIIGGVLLAGIMRQDLPRTLLFIMGGVIATILIIAAFLFLWVDNKK